MSKPITVGLELEMLAMSVPGPRLCDTYGFGRRTDTSILDASGARLPDHGPAAGIELVTPILEAQVDVTPDGNDDTFDFSHVVPTVQGLMACAAEVNSSCGLHVHLGRPNGERSTWNPRRLPNQYGGPMSEWAPSRVRTMLVICLGLENTVFNMVPESRKQSHYCRRIREIYDNTALQAYYPVDNLRPRKHDNPQRYCWLNLVETRRPADPNEERVGYARSTAYGTIEIRALGETYNSEYVVAWTKFWVKVAAAVAYLPAESAIMRCLYSGWLQRDIDTLLRCRQRHERTCAPAVRSVLPNTAGITQVATTENF